MKTQVSTPIGKKEKGQRLAFKRGEKASKKKGREDHLAETLPNCSQKRKPKAYLLSSLMTQPHSRNNLTTRLPTFKQTTKLPCILEHQPTSQVKTSFLASFPRLFAQMNFLSVLPSFLIAQGMTGLADSFTNHPSLFGYTSRCPKPKEQKKNLSIVPTSPFMHRQSSTNITRQPLIT